MKTVTIPQDDPHLRPRLLALNVPHRKVEEIWEAVQKPMIADIHYVMIVPRSIFRDPREPEPVDHIVIERTKQDS